jgi:hypothetical protein
MAEPHTERGELDQTSSPSPEGPAQAKNRRGIMEDYLYYATPPRAGLPQKIEKFEELSTKPTRVHIGGFGNDVSTLPQAPRNLYWVFPPPNNAAYEVDSHCRLPHLQYVVPKFLSSHHVIRSPNTTNIVRTSTQNTCNIYGHPRSKILVTSKGTCTEHFEEDHLKASLTGSK